MEKTRVCLIVDNPLRDLDGLILVSWHLSQMDVDVYLVPMYVQATDVIAIKPDLVLLNYLRPNNLNLARKYKSNGINIGVLDTEGTAGKDSDEFAQLTSSVGNLDLIDLYCFWGGDQYKSFVKLNKSIESALKVTGCPRYDFCNEKLQPILSKISNMGEFVLINTNFPVVNPRFSRGSDNEKEAMLKVGFESDFADQYIKDARIAFTSIIEVVENISNKFQNLNFVLRPHPFENIEAYAQLAHISNVFLKQEKTSIEWINSAKCLIHLNCSTAVEASMLGKHSISPEWLNTPALNVPNPNLVSFHAKNEENLVEMLDLLIKGVRLKGHQKIKESQDEIVKSFYANNDGHSAKRVAEEVIKSINNKKTITYKASNIFYINRAEVVFYLRQLLGYKIFSFIRNILKGKEEIAKQEGKYFSTNYVKNKLSKIQLCLANKDNRSVKVEYASQLNFDKNRSLSNKSIKIIYNKE